MAGKYAKVIDNLPRYQGDDPRYQEKVEAVKAAILAESGSSFIPASNLAYRFRKLRGDDDSILRAPRERIEAIIEEFGRDGLDEIVKEVNLRIEAIQQLMTDQFEVEDLSGVRMADGGLVSQIKEPYPKVEDKSKFLKWCIDNGLSNQLSLHVKTMESIVKQRLLDGEPEPDGVRAYFKTRYMLRKG